MIFFMFCIDIGVGARFLDTQILMDGGEEANTFSLQPRFWTHWWEFKWAACSA